MSNLKNKKQLSLVNSSEIVVNKGQQNRVFEMIKNNAFEDYVRERPITTYSSCMSNWYIYKPIVYFVILCLILLFLVNYF